MKNLLFLLLLTGCVTINKTYLPAAKKDTVYLPCNQIHIQPMPLPKWPAEPFYPLYRPQLWDTSRLMLGTIKIDTLKYWYDTTVFVRRSGDSISVR